MRGISVMDLSFPDALRDPDLQVRCLTYIAQHIKDVHPGLPDNVKPFVMRGRASQSGKDVPLLGLHERAASQGKAAWDYADALDKVQRWIDGQHPADLLARIAATTSPTFAELDDRKK